MPGRAPPPPPGPPPPGRPPPPPGTATAATGTGTRPATAAARGGATATGATTRAATTRTGRGRPGRHVHRARPGTAGTRATRTRATVATGTTGTVALRTAGAGPRAAAGGRTRTRATLTALTRRSRPAGCRRGRAHTGGRRAERVVTRPRAGTRGIARPARARRPTGTLATAGLATAAGSRLLRGVRDRRPGTGSRRPATGSTAATGSTGVGAAAGGAGRVRPRRTRNRRHRARRGLAWFGRSRGRGLRRVQPLGGRSTGRTRAGRCPRGCAGTGTGTGGGRRRAGPGPGAGLPVAVAIAVAGRPWARARRSAAVGPATGLAAPFGAKSFLEPAHDRRLDRRGRRTYELAHFLELDHHGLALDTELFREFVNPDLRHYAPLPGPGRTGPFTGPFAPVRGAGSAPGRRQPVVFIALCSSSAHRCLDLLSDRLPFWPFRSSCYAQWRRARKPTLTGRRGTR